MGAMARDLKFLEAKDLVIENLDAIQLSLIRCVEEGMIDLEDFYYNEVLALIEEAAIVSGWDELLEVVAKGKTLEIDIAAWLAHQGRTTLSLPWPRKS